MAATVGARIRERLHEHGIRHVPGDPGDGINGVLGGFHERVLVGRIEFEQARNLAPAVAKGDPARREIPRQPLAAS